MKGILTKTEKGWVVNYNYSINKNDWETLPLHPDFIELMDTCFTSKFTQDVEFEIVNIVSNKNTLSDDDNVLMGIYAKLIKSGHISDISKMVELPQQETLYTEEQVRDAINMADKYGYLLVSEKTEIIQSLKQPKKD